MPLDMGSLSHLRLVDPLGPATGPLDAEAYPTLGAWFRAMRLHRGLQLNDLATSTRIRKLYLQAMEDGDRSVLPSRPFAIGYVRAYAKALGLDSELAVERFKIDWPESGEPLRNPVGMKGEDDSRKNAIYVGVGVLVAAVALWNVAQRALVSDEPPASVLPKLEAQLKPPTGPVKLAGPLAAPAESTVPVPYITPGMVPDPAPGATPAASATSPVAVVASSPVFAAKGAVYGATTGPLVLQAKRPVSLVVRGGDRAVVFAQVLAAGEAWRAPLGQGLFAEATDPAALDLYVSGQLKGALAAPATPVDKLVAAPAPAAH